MDFSLKEFGYRLRVAREAVDLTRKQATDMIEIGERTLGSIERGESEMSVIKVFKAAELYKTTVSRLLLLSDSQIVNSFNNIQEKAMVHNQHNKIEVDADLLANRFSFLEKLVLEYQEERKVLLPKTF